jgi:hypothetical protein
MVHSSLFRASIWLRAGYVCVNHWKTAN